MTAHSHSRPRSLHFWPPLRALALASLMMQLAAVAMAQTAPSADGVQAAGARQDATDAGEKPVVRTEFGIIVGPDTTVVDGPIREGMIDYYAALNAKMSKGVTANSNAAAIFWETMGGEHSFFDDVSADDFFKRLGAQRPAGDASRWIEFADFVKQRGASPDNSKFLRESQPWGQLQRPWGAADYPLVAAWLQANAPALQRIGEGLARPDWYTPLMRPTSSPAATLIEAQIAAQSPREVARALGARSMLSAKQGKHRDAWADMLACHRLGRHVSNGPAMIDLLIGIAIDGVACGVDVELVNLKPPVALLSQMQTDLKRLRKLGATADVLDHGERYMFLDAVANLSAGRNAEGVLGGDVGGVLRKILGSPIDWNETLKLGNDYYDRIVANAALPTQEARAAAATKFSSDLNKLVADRPTPLGMAAILLAGNVDKRLGIEIGRILISLLLPAAEAGRSAETRSRMQSDLSLLAVALAEHRAKNGSFPASLEKLVGLPAEDRFSGRPLKYVVQGQGCLVYSVGRDLDDNGGMPADGLDGDLVVQLK